MAVKKHLYDINLNRNQILNAVLHTLPSAPDNARNGQVYYDSVEETVYVKTSSGWLDLAEMYEHNNYTPRSITTTGANVIATFTSDDEGHVTGITTRAMTLEDLGFTGDSNANHYVHPSYTNTDFTGGNIKIIQSIPITNGHIDGPITTRDLTGDDLAGLLIDDSSNTSLVRTWSADKLYKRFTNIENTIAGALVYQGGYDAATNTPNLETPEAGTVNQGFTYTVTTNGDFHGVSVEPGDMIIAEVNDPSEVGDWTIVNKNIDDILYATTTVAGKIELATQAEVDAGTDNTRAVTPRTLSVFANELIDSKSYVAVIGNGTATSYSVVHGLGTKNVIINVYDNNPNSDTYDEKVGVVEKTLSNSTVEIKVNEPLSTDELRVVIIAS